MLKQIKIAALGLFAASAILPVASPANAALSKTAQESVAEIQTEIPNEELIADKPYRVRVYRRRDRRPHRVRVYRSPRRPYRVRRVYRGRDRRPHRVRVYGSPRRPVRVIRRRTCYRSRYRTVCRYRTYRR